MLKIEDICSERDVLAYDSTLLEAFGPSPSEVSAILRDKRTVAVLSWLSISMEKAGYSPMRHSARRAPDRVFSRTAGVWADRTTAMGDKTFDDLDLATVLATPATDAIYVGFNEPMRALWVTMLDSVNVNTMVGSSLSFWSGSWEPFERFEDGTQARRATFGQSGRLGWTIPTDWEKRPLNGEDTWRFWARLQVSTPAAANTMLGQLLPIRTSRFSDPCVFYSLGLLYGESWGGQRGEWREKSAGYLKMASDALVDVLSLPMIADEFLLPDAEAVVMDSIGSTSPQAASDLTTWSRG